MNLILRLKGGLGNQIFQYAAARGVAHRNGARLCLDTFTGFASDPFSRRFRLNHFDINAELLPEQECHRRLARTRLTCKLRSYRERCFIQMLGRSYDPFIGNLRLSQDVVLEGFWQSERYFHDVANEIRKELRLSGDLSPESAAIATRIRDEGGIAVHIRRLHGVSAHGVKVEGRYGGSAAQMSLSEYYKRSLDRIRGTRRDLSVFVFSDSPDWVKENIRFDCPTTYVSHNGSERDYEDLLLMAACRDHVIANSSFSWWGAWLGEAPTRSFALPEISPPIRTCDPCGTSIPRPGW